MFFFQKIENFARYHLGKASTKKKKEIWAEVRGEGCVRVLGANFFFLSGQIFNA